MTAQQEALFDLMESESVLNIFVDGPGFKASSAAIIIIGSPVGHLPKKKGDKLTLWFGRGIERDSFKNFKEAAERAVKILSTTRAEVTFRIEGRYSKKFAKILKEHHQSLVLREEMQL